jgi:CBS domain-containing protein
VENDMKIKELMCPKVRSCFASDTLNFAAQLMWEGDCGILPVVDADGRVIGVITDRDVCMAAYTKGRPLAWLGVEEAMAKQVSSCSAEASVETALSLMREVRVRRLPVVDAEGKLVGILSLSDLARHARKESRGGAFTTMSADMADTLGVICEMRQPAGAPSKVESRRVGELVGAGV